MKRLMAGTLVAFASLTITAAAQAAPSTFYFNCPAATVAPVANTSTDTSPSWTATAPTGATTDGAGCLQGDPAFLVSTKPESTPSFLSDGVFGGLYKGEIRKLQFTLYGTSGNPVYDTAGLGDRDVLVSLAVDGELLLDQQEMTAPIEKASQPGTYSSTFTISGLNIPASAEDKQINIVINNNYADSHPIWLEGSADFPSSAKLFGFDDLSQEEQQEILCNEDPTQCPDDSGDE